MQTIKKLFLTILSTTIINFLFAQNIDDAGQSLMRSSGRIYVVIAVLLCILFGLFIYLFRIDKKISKLENKE